MISTIDSKDSLATTVRLVTTIISSRQKKDINPAFAFSFQKKVREDRVDFIVSIGNEELVDIGVSENGRTSSEISLSYHDPIMAVVQEYTGAIARVEYLNLMSMGNNQIVDGLPKFLIHSVKKLNGIVRYMIVVDIETWMKKKEILKEFIEEISQNYCLKINSIPDEPWNCIPNEGRDRGIIKLLWERNTDKEIAEKLSTSVKALSSKTISNRISKLRKQYGDSLVPRRMKN